MGEYNYDYKPPDRDIGVDDPEQETDDSQFDKDDDVHEEPYVDMGNFAEHSLTENARNILTNLKILWHRNKASLLIQLIATGVVCAYLAGASYASLFYSFHRGQTPSRLLYIPIGLSKNMITFVMLFLLSNGVILFLRYLFRPASGDYDATGKFHMASSGEHGTAHFMNDREIKKFLTISTPEDAVGDIIGYVLETEKKYVYTLNAKNLYRFNGHACVCGTSGSKKSRARIMVSILQCIRRGESVICMEPKGDAYRETAEFAKSQGYEVKLLDYKPDELRYSDACNYLMEVNGSVASAITIADVILRNTSDEDGKRGFWDDTQLNALVGTILITVNSANHPAKKNLVEVYKMLSEGDKALCTRFNALPEDHPGKLAGKYYVAAPDNVRTSAITSLGVRLGMLQDTDVQETLKHDEVGFINPGKKKCLYYIVCSDQESSLDFLVALYLNISFIKLVAFADSLGGKLPIRVQYVLDEFPNVAEIVDFVKKIETVRSRNIGILIAFQEIALMERRYPQLSDTIISACDMNYFLGTNSSDTADYYRKKLGVATVNAEQVRTNETRFMPMAPHPHFQKTEGTQSRDLRTTDELMDITLEDDEPAYVFIKGKKIVVGKFDYSNHPYAEKLVHCEISDHVQDWRREREQAAAAPYMEGKSDANISRNKKVSDNLKKSEPASPRNTVHATHSLRPDMAKNISAKPGGTKPAGVLNEKAKSTRPESIRPAMKAEQLEDRPVVGGRTRKVNEKRSDEELDYDYQDDSMTLDRRNSVMEEKRISPEMDEEPLVPKKRSFEPRSFDKTKKIGY